MKITEIKTYLMHAGVPGGGWTKRNWLFVKVFTDEGIYGVGEASGWPRVVETAIHDLREILIGEDPFLIERIWQKIYLAMMGHGNDRHRRWGCDDRHRDGPVGHQRQGAGRAGLEFVRGQDPGSYPALRARAYAGTGGRVGGAGLQRPQNWGRGQPDRQDTRFAGSCRTARST